MLATGSYPFVPPVPGKDAPGCFVYRTIEDLLAIEAYAERHATTGAVVGGGLLGLEAAGALKGLGLQTQAPAVAAVLSPDIADLAPPGDAPSGNRSTPKASPHPQDRPDSS